MALLKNSRKSQKNAAKSVISKNKMLQSKAIAKNKAVAKANTTIGSIVRKDKSPSTKSKKSSSNKKSKPSQSNAPYNRELLQKLYENGDKYLDSFPAPKTLNRDVIKGYDLNQGVDYNKMFANLKYTGFQASNLGLAIDRVN